MSIEKITAKIEGDAQAVADEIIGQAKKSAWDIVQNAEKQAEKIVQEAQIRGAADRDKQVVSRKAVAVIDGRNVTLSQKQELIDRCFAEAMERVSSMDKAAYMDFLTGLVKNSGLKSGGIILAEKDAALGEELIGRLNESIPGGDFSLSEEKKEITGGVMIAGGRSYYNASIDAIVREIRDEMTAEVADVLFGGEES